MGNNRRHTIVEPLTSFDLYGSLSSITETGKEKFIEVKILVPNFVNNGHLKSYEIGKPILDNNGSETGYDVGDEKSVRISIISTKRSGEDLFFEGVSDDGHNVEVRISRVHGRILKSLQFI